MLDDAAAVFISTPSADPRAVPPHNSGGAVDLTVVDAEGREVAMGTSFDDFSEYARTDYFQERDAQIHGHRMILKSVLEAEGFANYPEEWWHFDYGNQEWAMLMRAPAARYGRMEGR
jgi:D-alanyl-D-alanine dipeptidase